MPTEAQEATQNSRTDSGGASSGYAVTPPFRSLQTFPVILTMTSLGSHLENRDTGLDTVQVSP